MGFSPIDARAALVNAITKNGFDIQAATELDLYRAARPPPIHTESHVQPPNPCKTNLQLQHPLDITAETLLSQASKIGRVFSRQTRSREKEERGPPICMRRELQQMVRQLRMADHDGCASVTMRVVSHNNQTGGSVAVRSKLGSRMAKTRGVETETETSCMSSHTSVSVTATDPSTRA